MKKLTATVVLIASLAGCTSVPLADPQQDAALKSFTIAPDKAGVFIYRHQSRSGDVKMAIELDGEPLGQTIANTYLYKEVSPGRHQVTSKSENIDSLVFEARAGSLNYVWQDIKMGILAPRAKLHLASDSEGQSGVLASRLVESR